MIVMLFILFSHLDDVAAFRFFNLSFTLTLFHLSFGVFLLGEIFGGVLVESNSNDGEVLLQYLGGCCSHSCESDPCLDSFGCRRKEQCTTVPNALSRIKGPWAVIYWQVI